MMDPIKPGKIRPQRTRLTALTALGIAPLSACGGGSGSPVASSRDIGNILPNDFVAPAPTVYTAPGAPDPNAFALSRDFLDPYWVASLRGGYDETVTQILSDSARELVFVFPDVKPDYYVAAENTANWTPASAAVRAAFRDIFSEVSQIINVTFVEGTDLTGSNVIAISQTDQPVNTLGLAYFPNLGSLLGSDILIANAYSAPQRTGLTTNVDYETLVHELGHALGLKHPFEVEGGNTTTLNTNEDNSAWTAMTYTLVSAEYDGQFRSFDFMALTELYGVNPTYRAGDDTYTFSASAGTFIVDGGGSDTISAANQNLTALIDLRAGAQSYVGAQANLISSTNQLTISSGTQIENATGSALGDTLIGNDLSNFLDGGAGDDRLFGGAGSDQLRGGAGADIIDLSEAIGARDTVMLDLGGGGDLIYGFTQGAAADVISVRGVTTGRMQSLISEDNVPGAVVNSETLLLFGAGLNTAAGVRAALADGGAFDAIDYAAGASALLITAQSQATGQDQCVFHISNDGNLAVELLATLRGNYLDIDSWHGDNIA